MNRTPSEPLGLARFCWVSTVVLLGMMCLFQALNFLNYADMDFRIYYDASVALRTGQDMFAAWNPESPLTYIYPPFLAILFIPLTLLPLEVAAAVWTVISMILLSAMSLDRCPRHHDSISWCAGCRDPAGHHSDRRTPVGATDQG